MESGFGGSPRKVAEHRLTKRFSAPHSRGEPASVILLAPMRLGAPTLHRVIMLPKDPLARLTALVLEWDPGTNSPFPPPAGDVKLVNRTALWIFRAHNTPSEPHNGRSAIIVPVTCRSPCATMRPPPDPYTIARCARSTTTLAVH